jgi:hypothetical protein
VCGHTIEERE